MLDLPARRLIRAEFPERAAASPREPCAAGSRPCGPGLASRVLIITIGFVLLAMGLFYATRLAVYRETWLHNRLTMARAAMEVFDPRDANGPSEDLANKILKAVGVRSIAIVGPGGRREIAVQGAGLEHVETVGLNDDFIASLQDAFQALVSPPDQIIKVSDVLPAGAGVIEVVFDETPLIEGMWRVSRTFLNISLMIAAVVSCVLWAALWQMVLRPVRRLTSNIIAFGESPQDVARVITPGGRRDEIGRAERALAAMQNSLAHELAQRKRLAELGMAVARINHDLRNILTAAQLISDRLATIPDPLAQRLAPRLVATLDRAIQFCQATLTYGAAREQAPARRRFDLSETVRQVVESAQAENGDAIDYKIDIPPRFDLYADPDHVLRVLENLARNAAQVLIAKGSEGGRPKSIRFAAIRTDGLALIEISDTGPGFSADQSERIFEPFHKSTSEIGAGLGLAIAADLVARNGGSIALAPAKSDDFYCGARFLIKLPTPEQATRKLTRVAPEA
jgi:signal transduction histidine kinase